MRAQVSSLIILASLLGLSWAQDNELCPGASPEQYEGGSESCEEPAWNYWYFQNQILLPSRDPTRFYQTTTNAAVLMRCGLGTCFSQVNQYCVHFYEWKNPCEPKPVTVEDDFEETRIKVEIAANSEVPNEGTLLDGVADVPKAYKNVTIVEEELAHDSVNINEDTSNSFNRPIVPEAPKNDTVLVLAPNEISILLAPELDKKQ